MRRKKSSYADISGFGEVVKQLSKITGKNFEQVLQAELGHVLKGAMGKTKMASVNGRMRKGVRKGGIVPRHIPEGLKYAKGDGGKLITQYQGIKYHVAEPKLLIKHADERSFQKIPQKGVGRGRGLHPKRGGKVWLKPAGPWLGRDKFWGEMMPKWKSTVDRKIPNIGMGKGQWYWSAMKLGLKLPRPVGGEAKLLKPRIRSLVQPFIRPRKVVRKREASYIIETRGADITKHTRGAYALNSSASGRIKFFKMNVKKGFINDMKNYMPKKYPLLFK